METKKRFKMNYQDDKFWRPFCLSQIVNSGNSNSGWLIIIFFSFCQILNLSKVNFAVSTFLCPVQSKVTFFIFSREKVRGRTLTQNRKKCFFYFPEKWKRKKTVCFLFFSLEKFMSHSLNLFWVPFFFIQNHVWLVFFFRQFEINFFFPGKDYKSLTHSVKILGFFSDLGKKKQVFVTNSLDFGQKSPKDNLFRKIKKTVPLVQYWCFDKQYFFCDHIYPKYEFFIENEHTLSRYLPFQMTQFSILFGSKMVYYNSK